jgi:ABC-type lipoprotein release transport system permease subunit
VQFSLAAIVGVNLGVMLLSWLVVMLPALIISRISPATTMRYE